MASGDVLDVSMFVAFCRLPPAAAVGDMLVAAPKYGCAALSDERPSAPCVAAEAAFISGWNEKAPWRVASKPACWSGVN